MNELEYIVEVSFETFQSAVVERSQSVPVLVDFWADWCGPCQMQMPVLQKLAQDYAGKFILAKVNTEQEKQLAVTHNIRSLPTMRLYRHGEIAEEILGAQTESTLRNLLDRYIERPSDRIRAQARALLAAGRQPDAVALLSEEHDKEPDNHQLVLDLAELHLAGGEHAAARDLLAALPHDVRQESAAAQLAARIEFAEQAADTPSAAELAAAVDAAPDDLQLRYRLGCVNAANGDYPAALQAFMQVIRQDRQFADDAARKAILSVFELLGNEGELVSNYRRQLFNLLH